MNSIDTPAERVARGVKWLDAKHPGWEDKVDLEAFNIMSPCRCVLGFVLAADDEWMNGFDAGENALADDGLSAGSLGFDALCTDEPGWSDDDFQQLQAAWTAVLQARAQHGERA